MSLNIFIIYNNVLYCTCNDKWDLFLCALAFSSCTYWVASPIVLFTECVKIWNTKGNLECSYQWNHAESKYPTPNK